MLYLHAYQTHTHNWTLVGHEEGAKNSLWHDYTDESKKASATLCKKMFLRAILNFLAFRFWFSLSWHSSQTLSRLHLGSLQSVIRRYFSEIHKKYLVACRENSSWQLWLSKLMCHGQNLLNGFEVEGHCKVWMSDNIDIGENTFVSCLATWRQSKRCNQFYFHVSPYG